MNLNCERRGAGRPLLLVHGLGGSLRSWDPIAPALAATRELVLIDLPGHGRSPVLAGRQTIAAFADAIEAFIQAQGLPGVDLAGSSVGARLVLELSRRGVGGHCVALAQAAFPTARLHWFDDCGHFPQWDTPEKTVRVILETCT